MSNEITAPPALDIDQLSFSYSGKKALDQVGFTVKSSECTILLGPNGAGKSTLFSLITRLYDSRHGSVRLCGFDIKKQSGKALEKLGVVFQQSTLDLDLTVMQNLRYHSALHGMSRRLANQRIQQASHLIITLGTAWVYRFIETDHIVANCHKIPQKKFLKELLSVDDISESIDAIISLVKSVNNNVKIIFTVSPIRHLKDGYSENSLSKAHLLSAIHRIVEPRNQSYYFPSFEIMMDDLRDYRFYKNDMLHPNKTAINYIWEHFKSTWIDKKSFELMDEIESILKSLSHKPFDEKSEKHQQFLLQLNNKITSLKERYPEIQFN